MADISKIKDVNNNTYNIKDATAREAISNIIAITDEEIEAIVEASISSVEGVSF